MILSFWVSAHLQVRLLLVLGLYLSLGGGFKYVLFLSLLGEMIQFDEHIFQMGWFNHHLDHIYNPDDRRRFQPSGLPRSFASADHFLDA